jgi:radical SAM protein with 4Fe4S-binding SPASM domain
LGFFDQYYSLGFFTIDERFAGRILDVQPPADHLAGPLTVHLEVTARCNLRCCHCFADAPNVTDEQAELSLEELDGLFAEMAACGSFRLGLTGGEPLLRQDIIEIISLAENHGLSPCLTTNGLLVTEHLASAFAKHNLAWLNVSLEGATPATHDAVRGAGTFDQVQEAIKILRRHVAFSLAFTVTRRNYRELESCAKLAREVGAQAAVFRPLYPVGRARYQPEYRLTLAEYREAIASLARMGLSGEATLCDVHPWSPQSRGRSQSVLSVNFGCGAANSVCSVSASGAVSPCSFLGPEAVAGNLREASLQRIWHTSEVFRRIRDLPGDSRCVRCSDFDLCGGGCRARALALVPQATWNSPDPWCMAELSAILED